MERRHQAEEHRPAEGAKADPRPAVQWLSVEGGGVGQHLHAVRRSLMVGGVLLVGGLLDHADRLPSDLKSSSPTWLTFDPSVYLGADPSGNLSIDLALVGADGVPQIPVPQPCTHTYTEAG